MQSAFGVEHGEFGKRDNSARQNAQGSAIEGGGAVVGGTGLIAGGVPKGKSDSTAWKRAQDAKKAGAPLHRRLATTSKITPGGILGFRQHAHGGGIWDFKSKDTAAEWSGPAKTHKDAFFRGYNKGKIGPEEEVIRGLKTARTGANAALVGGAAAIAYGHHKKKIAKSRRSDSINATAAGLGGTTAVVTHAVPKFLDSKQRKYTEMAAHETEQADKLVPGMRGQRTGAAKRSPHLLHNASKEAVGVAGELRGAAAQHEHFADVFRTTSKGTKAFRNPAAAVGAVGVGGLAISAHRKKKY